MYYMFLPWLNLLCTFFKTIALADLRKIPSWSKAENVITFNETKFHLLFLNSDKVKPALAKP